MKLSGKREKPCVFFLVLLAGSIGAAVSGCTLPGIAGSSPVFSLHTALLLLRNARNFKVARQLQRLRGGI